MDQQSQNSRFFILEKRRQKALEIHRQRREEMFNKSRKLFDDEGSQNQEESCMTIQSKDLQMAEQPIIDQQMKIFRKENSKKRKRFEKYSKILQIADWMNSVPDDLDHFYAAARPSGKTCLLVFENSKASIYDKTGSRICNFDPKKKNYDGIMLEIIYDQVNKIAYVTDLISWKGNIFTSEEFEFRLGWLTANLMTVKIPNLAIVLLSYYPVTIENLKMIYSEQFDFQKQGIRFVHKESLYIHEVNPNVLIWKDPHTSKYTIDQVEQGQQKWIYGVGRIKKDGTVTSQDQYRLGKIPQTKDKHRGFLRFRVSGKLSTKPKQTNMKEGQDETEIQFQHFEVVNFKGYSRTRADPFSRILFQHRMKNQPLAILEIAQKLQEQK